MPPLNLFSRKIPAIGTIVRWVQWYTGYNGWYIGTMVHWQWGRPSRSQAHPNLFCHSKSIYSNKTVKYYNKVKHSIKAVSKTSFPTDLQSLATHWYNESSYYTLFFNETVSGEGVTSVPLYYCTIMSLYHCTIVPQYQ